MNFPKWFLQIPKMSIDFTCFMNNNKKSRQLVVKIRDIITISNYCVVSKQEVHEEDLRMLCLATWFFSSFYVVKRVTDGLPRENQNCSSRCWKRHHFCSKLLRQVTGGSPDSGGGKENRLYLLMQHRLCGPVCTITHKSLSSFTSQSLTALNAETQLVVS